MKNLGSNASVSRYHDNLEPWHIQTGKGIFSSPVIDSEERVYIGSADRHFYAVDRQGNILWTFESGEVIDSAALLSQCGNERFITIPSGDGKLYHMRLPGKLETGPGVEWIFDSSQYPHPAGVGYTWFEGHVSVSPEGNLYAGNTNWNFYAIDAQGEFLWSFPANNMNWAIASFDEDRGLYWSSLDRSIRKLDRFSGEPIWSFQTLGFNASSVLLAPNGLVLVGSFDGNLYSLSKETGKLVWKFKTDDHIYASPALSYTNEQTIKSIYITSTDGKLYALTEDGQLRWSFDTGSQIRSSPVVNQTADGQDVIYFGAGNGLVYAINEDGSQRWAYDTNQTDPELVHRNDLNASPALGRFGLAIGGEHGFLWYIPYDYPLFAKDDPRVVPAPPPPSEGVKLALMSAGWNKVDKNELAREALIQLKLYEHRDGERVYSGLNTWFGRSQIEIEPELDFSWQVSGAADEIYIRPRGFLEPQTHYRIRIQGETMSGGLRFGNLELGASQLTSFTTELSFTSKPRSSATVDWRGSEWESLAFEVYRPALPSPSMLPSLNQIGFDSLHWLVSIVDVQVSPDPNVRPKVLALLQEAVRVGDRYELLGPQGIAVPLSGVLDGPSFILRGQDLKLEVAGIALSLSELELRGAFNSSLQVGENAHLYAEIAPFSDINYGPLLAVSGLVNSSGKIAASGTFLSRPYQAPEQGVASNQMPENFQLIEAKLVGRNFLKAGSVSLKAEGIKPASDVVKLLVYDQNDRLHLLENREVQDGTLNRSLIFDLPKGLRLDQSRLYLTVNQYHHRISLTSD
jgi:outer membrane protein assembly factor BamB